jgi:hypothetical protein
MTLTIKTVGEFLVVGLGLLANRYSQSDGFIAIMTDAHRPAAYPKLICNLFSITVKHKGGLTGWQMHNFNVTPLDIANPCSQGFRNSFFGGK